MLPSINNTLKKMKNASSQNQIKEQSSRPSIRLTEPSNEHYIPKSDKNARSPSLNPSSEKHKRDSSLIFFSPGTRLKSLSNLPRSECKTVPVKKTSAVSVILSDEEKAQYGDRSLADYEKKELLGK